MMQKLLRFGHVSPLWIPNIAFLNVCPFDDTAFAVSGKVERSWTGLTTPVVPLNRFNHTIWIAVLTPKDRP